MKKTLHHVALSSSLLLIWMGILFALGGLAHLLPGPSLEFSVMTELAVATLLAAATFSRLFARYSWVAGYVFKFRLAAISVGLLAGTFVIVVSFGLAYCFGNYILPCTNCGRLDDYFGLFLSGFGIGAAEEVWHSGVVFVALLILIPQLRWRWICIIAMSFLFMRFHSYQTRSDALHIARLLIAGATFAAVTLTFRSIWPAVALHGMLDGLIRVFLEGGPGLNPAFATGSDAPSLIQSAPLLLIFLACLVYCLKNMGRSQTIGSPESRLVGWF